MACERYGWTVEYTIWGVSYLNVMMMLMDAISYDYDYKGCSSKSKYKPNKDISKSFKGNFKDFMQFAKQVKQ